MTTLATVSDRHGLTITRPGGSTITVTLPPRGKCARRERKILAMLPDHPDCHLCGVGLRHNHLFHIRPELVVVNGRDELICYDCDGALWKLGEIAIRRVQ
jgi:hypothetical protein